METGKLVARADLNPTYIGSTGSLFHFARGRTHGGGLLGLGVNADQRHSAHSARGWR